MDPPAKVYTELVWVVSGTHITLPDYIDGYYLTEREAHAAWSKIKQFEPSHFVTIKSRPIKVYRKNE